MNKIIRRAFSNSGGKMLATVILAAHGFSGRANPLGGIVTHGSATINSGGGLLTVNQSSGRAIINWGSFNIGQGETTLFQFNGAAGGRSAVLNLVSAGNPSVIAGILESRVGPGGPIGGTVLILNPSGMLFTPTSQINVGSLIATTLSLTDQNQFLNNHNLRFSGNSIAGIQNQGRVSALGDVFLIAQTVQNAGSITAGGTAGLAAGTTVTLAQSGSERLTVQAGTAVGSAVGVENAAAGQIHAVTTELKAAGGNIYALAINNGGAIRADTVTHQGGRVFLRSSGGTVQNLGTIDASGIAAGARGGVVQITGGQVHLAGGSTIDVSGEAGGGNALVGGGYRGASIGGPNSQTTTVDAGATLRADAGASGRGGRVVVWSDGSTDFHGAISARGGASSGDGGAVEVSGHQHLSYQGTVDASAPVGRTGQLLMDPAGDVFVGTTDPGDGSSFVSVASLDTSVANATLQANHDVIFGAPVSMANNGIGFTAQAGNNILVNNAIQTRGGPVILSANDNFAGTASGSGSILVSASIDTSLGAQANGAISLAINGGAGNIQLGSDLTTGGGASGSLTFNGPVVQTAASHLSASSLVLGGPTWNSANNDLHLTIGGNVSVPSIFAGVGNFTSDGAGGTTIAGNFTTSGSQNYGNAVAQTANAHLTATALTVGPSWNAGGHDLQLSIAGPVTVPSVFANVGNFTSDGAGGTTIAGDFTTSGFQNYGNAVVQSANAHLTATALTLGPSWNAGGHDLQLSIAGPVTVPSVFANVGNFTSDGAGGTTIAGNFSTSGSQNYANAVVQSANAHLTATALTLGPSWNAGGHDLQLSIAGPVTVPSVFANVGNFTSDGAGGTTIAGNFATSGSQNYANAVVQTANAHLTATALTLGPSWNAGGHDLQLSIAGPVTVPSVFANVGNFISDGAGGTTIAGNFSTSGSQNYGNAVVQTANAHLTATALTLGPSWNAGGHDLQLSIAGSVTVPSVFANVGNFTSDGAGGTTIAGNFSTSGSQNYANAVVQSANAHLTATALTLGPSWNAGGHDLQLSIAGPVTVPSVFANVGNFTSDGAGGTTIAGDFTTGGSQNYGNAVVQSANAHLTASALTLGPSWNAGGHDLQLSIAGPVTVPSVFANVGNFTSDGAGGTTIAGNFSTSGSQNYANAVVQSANAHLTATALTLGPSWNAGGHDLQLSIAGPVTVPSVFASVGNFTSDGAGGTTIAGNFTTSGSQNYVNAVAQTANAHLTASALALGPSWNAGGHDLQLSIAGPVTVPSVFANVGNFTSDGAGGTTIAGNFTTTGSQVYNNAVTLLQTLTLAGTSVAFDGGLSGGAHDLTLNANARFGGTANGLGNLTINGTTALNGASVTTSGGQNYNGAVTLGGNSSVSGSTLAFNGDLTGGGHDLTLNGASTIGSSAANLVNGLGVWTLNGASTLNAGSIGAASITINGNATLNGGAISTAGAQAYNGAVTLGVDHQLTGSSIGFNGALIGGGHNLTASAATTFGGAASGLSSLTVNGATTLAGGTVTTSGAQTYNGATTLGTDNTLSGTSVAFGHGLNGGEHSLTVNGDTTVGTGAADSISSLATLSVSGNATLNGTFHNPGQPAGGTTTRFNVGGNLVIKSKIVDFNTANIIANADKNSVNGDWIRGTGIEASLVSGQPVFFWFSPLGATNPGEDTFRRLLAAVLPRARKSDQQETKASEGTRPPIDFAGWNKGSSEVYRETVAAGN